MKHVFTAIFFVQAMSVPLLTLADSTADSDAVGYLSLIEELNKSIREPVPQIASLSDHYNSVPDRIVDAMKEMRAYYHGAPKNFETRLKAFKDAWDLVNIPSTILAYLDKDSALGVQDIYGAAGLHVVYLERPRPARCDGRVDKNDRLSNYGTPKGQMTLQVFDRDLHGSSQLQSAIGDDPFYGKKSIEKDDERTKMETIVPLFIQDWKSHYRDEWIEEWRKIKASDLDAVDGAPDYADILIIVWVDSGNRGWSDVVVNIKYHVVHLREGSWISGSYEVSDQRRMGEGSEDSLESLLLYSLPFPCEEIVVFSATDLFGAIAESLGGGYVQERRFDVSIEDMIDEIVSDVEEIEYDKSKFEREFDRRIDDAANSDLIENVVRVFTHSRGRDGPVPRGSGFYVTPNIVVTNYHVVSEPEYENDLVGGRARQYVIINNRGQYFLGNVGAFDVNRDLALVFVPEKSMDGTERIQRERGLRIQGLEALPLGQEVFSLGHPKSWDYTLSRGVISSFRKLDVGEGGRRVGVIQTDAALAPGSSGGPLVVVEVDGEVRVVGVNTLRRGEAVDGLNFAVAYSEVRAFLGEQGFSFDDGRVTY